VVTCVREHTQTPVLDRRCAHLEKPMTQPIRCNLKDCPPHWEGHWTPCSATCGEGIQHFVPKCHQELSTGRQIVTNDMACPRPKPASQAKPCIQEPCDSIRDNELPQTPETSLRNIRQEWSVGPWSSVSPTTISYKEVQNEGLYLFSSVLCRAALATAPAPSLAPPAGATPKTAPSTPNTARTVLVRHR
jgi:hypothetical protein